MYLFRLLLLTAGAFAAEYGYDRCDTAKGPAAWGTLPGSATCGTTSRPQREGSPINLCGAVPFGGPAPTFSVSGYDVPRTMLGSGDKMNVEAAVANDPPILTLGDISTIVGRTSNTSVQTWKLQQMHSHWGRAGALTEGSEHYMQGSAFPFEAHLVHYNSRFSSFSAAVASGASDALLVVGVFFSIGTTDADLIATLGNAAPTLTKTPRPLGDNIILSDIFNGTGAYYSYKGSLTTPGCAEIVTWVVMKEPRSITLSTLNKFKEVTKNPNGPTSPTFGNNRNLQPRNGRIVYSSDGVTDGCRPFTEEQTCTNTASNGLLFRLVCGGP